ncbi:MAG: DUF4147 domain-containing protein [Candidatus Thermoplasmatota archaeon]|nr:DUF4147 domain-containing protein [Candidatus Thermoplasmatota archaeon]
MLFKNHQQLIKNGHTDEQRKKRADVLEILTAAVSTVDPYHVVHSLFDDDTLCIQNNRIALSDFTNIYAVGFGKASIGMTQAVCDSITVHKGIAVTTDSERTVNDPVVTTIVGGHPLPTNGSLEGATAILELAQKTTENDLLLVLVSGGGSALLCKPRVSLNDLQQTTTLLLHSGATITEMNTIRKHLSQVKGGQLAHATNATVVSLIISDIVGDPPEFIASGPTCPDSTTYADAKRILNRYGLWEQVPNSVRTVIATGIEGNIPETPKPGDAAFDRVTNYIVANNKRACAAAEEKARDLGYETIVLTTSLTGEAKEVGKYLANRAKAYETHGKQTIFITSGETTVTVSGGGKGGRNQELILGSLPELVDTDMVFASFATDGKDGMSDAAGAIADGNSLQRAKNKHLDRSVFLEENNSYEFFKEIQDALMTGATGTNVMDVQLLLK